MLVIEHHVISHGDDCSLRFYSHHPRIKASILSMVRFGAESGAFVDSFGSAFASQEDDHLAHRIYHNGESVRGNSMNQISVKIAGMYEPSLPIPLPLPLSLVLPPPLP